MQKDKLIAIIIIILAVFILLFAFVLIIIYGRANKSNNIGIYNGNDLYFLIKSKDTYGIAKADGTIVANPEFSEITRIGDTVYLKSTSGSMLYSLTDGKYQKLDGKESDVMFAYSQDDKLLPYFILKYGSSDSAIYRIYKDDGNRYTTTDYTNLNDVYNTINARLTFVSKAFPASLQQKYNVNNEIPYLTKDLKHQYIVTKSSDNSSLKGVIDEDGKVIVDFKYTDISVTKNDSVALVLKNDSGEFVFTVNEKLGKVDTDFDICAIEPGYYLQLRGSTVNKIYDSNLNLVSDGIYNYPNDFIFANNIDSKPYLLLKTSDTQYTLYGPDVQTQNQNVYSNLSTDYLKNYNDEGYRMSSVIFNNKSNTYAINMSNLQVYKVSIKSANLVSPLDYAVIYK